MYAVEMHGITKQFKNVLANSNVELMVKRGEIPIRCWVKTVRASPH